MLTSWILEGISSCIVPSSSTSPWFVDESELRAVVRPSENSTNAVSKFLEDSSIPRSVFEQHGDWIDVTTDLETANKMMDASFKMNALSGGSLVSYKFLHFYR